MPPPITLPDGRGIYHPQRACAWCAWALSSQLKLVPFKRTETLALVCRDVVACARRQLRLKTAGRATASGLATEGDSDFYYEGEAA